MKSGRNTVHNPKNELSQPVEIFPKAFENKGFRLVDNSVDNVNNFGY